MPVKLSLIFIINGIIGHVSLLNMKYLQYNICNNTTHIALYETLFTQHIDSQKLLAYNLSS